MAPKKRNRHEISGGRPEQAEGRVDHCRRKRPVSRNAHPHCSRPHARSAGEPGKVPRTGIQSDTELLEVALANLAVAEIFPSGSCRGKAQSPRTSILSSDFERTLRRLKPAKQRRRLKPRSESEFAFFGGPFQSPHSLLYDTTVYVDILQGRFPAAEETMLCAVDAWHSSVAESELTSICSFGPAQCEYPRSDETGYCGHRSNVGA